MIRDFVFYAELAKPATSERSMPLQIAAEIITASKIAKTLADLDGAGTDVEFAVLFRMVEIWRASRNKTANPYVIVIAI
jgi:hypothetical protein